MSNSWEHKDSEVQNKKPSMNFEDDVIKKTAWFYL